MNKINLPHINLSMSDERQATLIKVFAVAVAMPRWIGALLEAEGVPLPSNWLGWWVVFSALCAAGMAIVETFAFAYCLRSWRGMVGRSSTVMAVMIGASAAAFVVVLTPYIEANVSKIAMSSLLTGWGLLIWSIAVALSTILIIASVGYAQKRPVTRQGDKPATQARHDAPTPDSDATVTRQPATREEFVTAWRDNGHKHVAELAQELGVNVRTAQRWIAQDEKQA